MASGRFDVTRNRRMGDSHFFNKENGDLRGRGEERTLGHRGSDGEISKVVENGTRKRKFSPITWDEVEGAEVRISTKKLSGRHSDILPKSFSEVSDSGMNADGVWVYPVDDQIEVSQGSTVENVSGSNGSSASIISESRADLTPWGREGHGNRGDAFKRLEDNEFFGDYHISKSRWASGDDDAMADMCCADDEGMPKRRETPSSPESGEFRMEEHSSNRAGSMGSNEGSCVLEASHGDECPDFMEIEDRHGESKGVFQLHIEDPSSPVQGRMNILQSCRSVFEYERLNKISEGAYGVVFRARDKNTGEIVALKKVKMGREAAREGFPLTALREINILMSFNHPSIVSLKEVATDEGDGIFMVMEYMEHELKGLVDKMKQPFSTSEVKCLMLQILEGVQFLHDNWVIHRDLKTSNILFNNRGVLKICDFGMARQYGSLKPYTSLVVTLWYRAPELLLGEKQYSTAVDMWSVGCIMAELLLGKPLFKGESEIDQLGKIFKTLGSPNERTWPGFLELPGSKASFVSQPYNMLRKVLPAASFTGSPILSDSGFDLLNRLLTFDPNKRITAEAALNHNWFHEVPLPKSKDFMPTFPVQCVQGWSHEQISRKYR